MLAFKKVLPLFICFFVLSLFSAFFLQTGVVQAKGEKYTYQGSEIKASGGNYEGTLTFKKGEQGEINNSFDAYYATGKTKNGCEYRFIMAVQKSDKSKGQLSKAIDQSNDVTSQCDGISDEISVDPKGFDKTFTIANAPGQEEENENGENAGNQQPEARCELESLGWIICPILTISAKVITGLGNMLDTLLFLDPLTIPTSTDLNTVEEGQQARVAAFVVWQNMRNFANILFLLFFMFAIFAIATGMGLNNYTIKRILPRVIIAAILINLSYYIFAFVIDVTNVAGRGVAGLLNIKIPSAQEATVEAGDLGLYGIGAVAGLTGLAITGTLAAILIPFVIGVVVGVLVLLLIVILREVLIVFLVVLSPIFAVLWILPNTEGVARRYVGFTRTVLLIYPFMMAGIAFSNIAAQLILAIGYTNS